MSDTSPKKRGRPTLPASQRRTVMFGFRLTNDEATALRELAASRESKAGDLVRRAVLRFIANRNTPQPPNPNVID